MPLKWVANYTLICKKFEEFSHEMAGKSVNTLNEQERALYLRLSKPG